MRRACSRVTCITQVQSKHPREKVRAMSDFTTTITIAGPPADVFAAILDTRAWWNQAIDGPTATIGDEFGFEVEGLHKIRVRVTDVTPNQRVEWLVFENHFAFIKD